LAGKGKQGRRNRQVKAARRGRLGHWLVSRVEKQRHSHAADAGSLADRQVGRLVPGRKHKIPVDRWLMLVICKHDTGFECASCSIDW
jgi:hypothetical protein